jgi:hypothetical protein
LRVWLDRGLNERSRHELVYTLPFYLCGCFPSHTQLAEWIALLADSVGLLVDSLYIIYILQASLMNTSCALNARDIFESPFLCCTMSMSSPPLFNEFRPVRYQTFNPVNMYEYVRTYLVQAWFQGSRPGVSVCNLAYSIGTPPWPKIPFFSSAIRYNLPASFVPGGSMVLNSSIAPCIDWYILFSLDQQTIPQNPLLTPIRQPKAPERT